MCLIHINYPIGGIVVSIYRKILVPVDGSKDSFKALTHAIELATCCQAELGILCVIKLFEQLSVYTQLSTSYIPTQVYDGIEELGQSILDQATKMLPPSIKTAHTFLEIGVPIEVIPRFAKDRQYDLIVIGSRGMGVIKGLVMGSVSTHVVIHAQCPVLVIK
jgi:nucleotide-binding universal stress UspA family protein